MTVDEYLQSLISKYRVWWPDFRIRMGELRSRLPVAFSRYYAFIWAHYYKRLQYLYAWKARFSVVALLVFSALIISAIAYFALELQGLFENLFPKEGNKFTDLRSLFLGLGSALVGATPIAFSLVIFAMQVNVERMPYGLFHKLSMDNRIILAFVGMLFCAIYIPCLSLIPNPSYVAMAVISSVWVGVLLSTLFVLAYRRAVLLINPLEQLKIVHKEAIKEMKIMVRWAQQVAPLFKNTVNGSPDIPGQDSARMTYFHANPHWTNQAFQALRYSVSYARRYAEDGDYEVSGAALNTVIAINSNYIVAKGKTFLSDHPLIDESLSNDVFINETLEQLRQIIQVGIARKDEQQIEQTLKAIGGLVVVYSKIEYLGKHYSRTHSHLAANYLVDAVKSVAPQEMTDVLMEGVKLIGNSGKIILAHGESKYLTTTAGHISVIACIGCAHEKHRPVTRVAIEQLADLSFALIRSSPDDNLHFVSEGIINNIVMVAKLFLKVPALPFDSTHSFYLAPYYEFSSQSFPARLTDLVNAVASAKPADKSAKAVIRNIEVWADGIFQSQKELLLFSVQMRSSFTYNLIFWIAHISKLLVFLSNAPACDDYSRGKLRKHARRLFETLSWIPDDNESVGFVENYKLTEVFFEGAMDAFNQGRPEIAEEIQKLLLQWAFKGNKHKRGVSIIENSFCGLATLALVMENSEMLVREISSRLNKGDIPEEEIRNQAADGIRKKAESLGRDPYSFSSIEREMNRMDRDKIRGRLGELANLLSPEQSDPDPSTRNI